ncbi:MAG: metal ABC transporter permease [Lentisphaerae bacterium]|nr:metal ABC transporter permease [Lentisphaerota bacterium]
MLPLECMQYHFMQMALLALLLIAPLTAAAGVQVINFRMAFFADTIGHSAFAGAALGLLLLGHDGPLWSMPLLAMLIGLGVMWLKNSSKLSADTVIGIFFAFIVSGGLLLTSRSHELGHMAQSFIFGDILLVSSEDIIMLAILNVIYLFFNILCSNRMLLIAIDEDLARSCRIKTTLCSYLHIVLLALIVIMSIKASGVLLAGALLIVPAATARNLAGRAGSVVLYAVTAGSVAAVAGLFISVNEQVNTASGATIVMVGCLLFAVSCAVKAVRSRLVK